MIDFCCNNDYNLNGNFDFVDGRIYNAFVTLRLDGREPKNINELLDGYNSIYEDAPLSINDIKSIPAKNCSDFNLNGEIDFVDGRIFNAFITLLLDGKRPNTIYELLDGYNSIYTDAPLSIDELNHLPILETDTQIITKNGVIPRNCLDKLWISFTGNGHYSEWYELQSQEDSNFTKFKIVDPDYNLKLQAWAKNKLTNIQGILITTSNNRPNQESLTDEEQKNSYNSHLLNFNCQQKFNNDHGCNDDQVNMRIVSYTNQNKLHIKKYGSFDNSHGYLNEDKPWSGANMVYIAPVFTSLVIDNSGKETIDIEYIYFVRNTNEDDKVKFSEGNPENSICLEPIGIN